MDNISITNPALTYVSAYDKTTGERLTSYVTGVHADTVEGLEAIAKTNHPDAALITQTAAEYTTAINGDYIYKDGSLSARPALTEDEKREQELKSLDSEYSQKIADVETEMARAKAIDDSDYFADLKTERETLVNEYTEKRGEI